MLRISAIAALAMGLSGAFAQDIVTPNANLKADGMPAISKAIADKVSLYTEFRGYGFVQWHPKDGSMLVRHREAGANIAQIYLLRKPGGAIEKISDFPEPISQASYEPINGKFLVISKDTGGNEATQVYRMDLTTRETVLLSQADERSSFNWNHKGDRVLISAVPLDKTATGGKRDNVETHLTLVDPLKPNNPTGPGLTARWRLGRLRLLAQRRHHCRRAVPHTQRCRCVFDQRQDRASARRSCRKRVRRLQATAALNGAKTTVACSSPPTRVASFPSWPTTTPRPPN